jgi:iron complex outermembrane receptor protein
MAFVVRSRSRSRSQSRFRSAPAGLAVACALTAAGTAQAQQQAVAAAAAPPASAPSSSPDTPVQRVDVTGRAATSQAAVTGFDAPLAKTPIQATVVDDELLRDVGAVNLDALTQLDASVSDAYNSAGYWTFLTIRGFVIDNRLNYRRDGLPINAETSLPLANKESVEVLKGTSGLQAGVSSPGGLVNLVVKRPDVDLQRVTVFAEQEGTVGTSLDWSRRFGSEREFGARLNVESARLDPQVRDLVGHRHSISLAADWRPSAGTSLEVEWETSHQSEPSQPGFSLLGDTLPSPHAIDPRTNLNDQPWSLPVVLQGNTGSIRWRQRLDDAWTLELHAGTQRLVSNDRVAFPYGYYDDPVNYACDPCDRFTSDGRFTIWDYRSEDERRRTNAVDLSLQGHFATGSVTHALAVGAMDWSYLGRFNDEAYNIAGTGTIDGLTVVPPSPEPTTPNTDLTERTLELYARDHAELGADWAAWAGLRHTRVHRESYPTPAGDPSEATDYRQAFTTPWLALSRALTPADLLYVSWGEGIQSDVTPNLGAYVNKGQALPEQVSRQWELGFKHAAGHTRWGIDGFDVTQPQFTDVDVGSGDTPQLVRELDGRVHVRGLEADVESRLGAFTLRGSALWQRARREGAADPSSNGLRPPNVPERALKGQVGYDVAAIAGLRFTLGFDHEGDRAVLPDDSVNIPAWTQWDLGARYSQTLAGATLVWRAGVDNVTDARAWRESPYQYDHAYLFPLAPRTWRISLEALL